MKRVRLCSCLMILVEVVNSSWWCSLSCSISWCMYRSGCEESSAVVALWYSFRNVTICSCVFGGICGDSSVVLSAVIMLSLCWCVICVMWVRLIVCSSIGGRVSVRMIVPASLGLISSCSHVSRSCILVCWKNVVAFDRW